MAWSAVSSAVNTIGNLLAQEAVYLWGVEEQVDRLQTELKWMQSSLIEADAKQAKDRRIRLWVAEIRELAYDAEDVIEDFALRIGSRRNAGLSSCIKRAACVLKDGRRLHETRSKIDKIFTRITDDCRDEEITEELFNFLKKKKCLVIVDDVWSTQAWDSIKPAFPDKETRTKILLTSRNTEVVSHADSRGHLHQLQCLDQDQSWELLHKIAFSQGRKVEGRMEELGKKMVGHCKGFPLAIVVLGGILATKDSVNEWQIVSENVISYLKRGKGHGVEEVLALSYDDLPHYLRPCFLYLGVFPEDYEIQTDRLIQLWVAEGIVLSEEDGNEGIMTEDLAEGYLMELVERCMLQVRERDVANLKIKTVQMHDLMRNLCLSKAKQENFLCFVDESNASSISTLRRMHRVSASCILWIERIKSPNLRSLFFFGKPSVELFRQMKVFRNLVTQKMLIYLENHTDPAENRCLFYFGALFLFFVLIPEFHRLYTYLFNNFKLLRVFNHEGESFSGMGCKLPSDIGNLVHLRFLSLRDGFIFLPSSLGNLRCLQTLDVRFGHFVVVPNVIWRMEQLRHLYLPDPEKGYVVTTKLKLATLRNLQTLVNFNTEICYVKDLMNMTNLRELVIRGPFEIKDFNADTPIIQSKYLHSLSIINGGRRIDPRHLNHLLSSCVSISKLVLDVEIRELPEYHHLSSGLAYIKLTRCKLEEDPMPKLEKLPNLRALELHQKAFTGEIMVCSAQGFPKLESLSLKDLRHLGEWRVDEGAMACLGRLEIESCRGLKMLTDGLRFITTLQQLKIEGMPKAFKERVEEGGEDFDKVRHVPSITFKGCDDK